MKVSVSVPDDLWATAAAKCGRSAGASQVVQEALTAFVGRAETGPAYARARPPGIEAALKAAQDRMEHEASQEFQNGYSAAVDVATLLPWSELEVLAEDAEFGLGAWREFVIPEEWPGGEEPVYVEHLRRALGFPFDQNAHFSPGPTYLQGFRTAMRELWDSVSRPALGSEGG